METAHVDSISRNLAERNRKSQGSNVCFCFWYEGSNLNVFRPGRKHKQKGRGCDSSKEGNNR